INFSRAFPTCHDVNLLTRDTKHLDVIIGFSTGDIVWLNPICSRYHRLNKQGVVNASAVTAIQWIPGSDQLFMVAFKDGCMAIFDREKEDQPVSLQSNHRNTKFHVTKAPKGSKHNPTSYWQVSPRAVTAFAISPDCQHMAMTSLDGCLRIVDLIQEKLIHTFESYFGGLTCVAWSPDGKYVITGGQDDLVSIWSFLDHCIVARCQGHQSWVTDVAFDNWKCDEDQYRFGSVGEDGQILLWDFSVQTLGRPKVVHIYIIFISIILM
ncbi:catabolite repression protein creC, partial [Syncephalis fuscata]